MKIYAFFHLVLIMFSIFIAYRCDEGFNAVSMGAALFCPHLFLIYIAATKGLGFCFNPKESDEYSE